MSEPVCARTELPVSGCHHCRPVPVTSSVALTTDARPIPAAGLVLPDLRRPASRARAEQASAPFPARYDSRCAAECGEWVDEGELICMVDGAAVHEGCT